MDWVLQAAAATALLWSVETLVLAARATQRDTSRNDSTATREHYVNGFLFAFAMTMLVVVQAMLMAFVVATDEPQTPFSGVLNFTLFGGMTGYLWTVVCRRWRLLFELHLSSDARSAPPHAHETPAPSTPTGDSH